MSRPRIERRRLQGGLPFNRDEKGLHVLSGYANRYGERSVRNRIQERRPVSYPESGNKENHQRGKERRSRTVDRPRNKPTERPRLFQETRRNSGTGIPLPERQVSRRNRQTEDFRAASHGERYQGGNDDRSGDVYQPRKGGESTGSSREESRDRSGQSRSRYRPFNRSSRRRGRRGGGRQS